MPIARFQMPDGRVARFEVPEGTTPEQAQMMMGEHFAQPQAQPQAPQPQVQDQATLGQEAQASIPGRFLQGLRDPIDQAAAMLPKGLEAVTSGFGTVPNPVSKFFGGEAGRVQDINKANEQAYQQAKQATGTSGIDAARFVGNVASPANLAIASKLPVAATLGQKMLQGAGIGAAGGALGGEADVNSPDYWKEKGGSAALGAALGGVIPAAVQGVSRVVKPEVNPKVLELLRQGVTPTPGQIMGGAAQKMEEKLQSVPIFGDIITRAKNKSVEEFNKAALNRALSPLGEKVDDIGREGVQQVKQKLKDAYDKLLPNIGFTPDAQFTQEFATVQKMAQGLGAQEQKKFQSIIADAMSKASPNGSMDGATFKIVESKLSKEASKFTGSTDAYQKELGDALNETLRVMRDTLPRVNPNYADDLKAINQGYANYTRIRQAASSTATGAREGVFTPAQLAQAIRAQDKSAGKGASATGKALMQDLAEQGTNVLGSKVPDSGTAGRLLPLAGAGVAGATGTLLPAAAGLGIAALPYLGRKTAAKLMTERPASAAELARLLRSGSPLLSGAVPFAVENQ